MKTTVLLIDDEEIVLRAIPRSIKNFSWVTAADGASALQALKNNPQIQAALVDVNLPDVTGYELSAMLRDVRPNLPVVLITGGRFDQNLVKISGASGIISKPYSKKELTEAVEKTQDDLEENQESPFGDVFEFELPKKILHALAQSEQQRRESAAARRTAALRIMRKNGEH